VDNFLKVIAPVGYVMTQKGDPFIKMFITLSEVRLLFSFFSD